jgi:putative ABC transport system substrate-binding protein
MRHSQIKALPRELVTPVALAVLADRFLMAHRKSIVEFAAANQLPSMYPCREYVDAGGLISYAPSNIELFRGAATYVDKILKGAKPSEIAETPIASRSGPGAGHPYRLADRLCL